MKSIVYQELTPKSEIDTIWESYYKTKDRKQRSQLREEYNRLVEEDKSQSGFKRYNNL